MKVKLRHNRGFTLVELLVVISIIAVLASVAIPAFTGVQMRANMTAAGNSAHGIFLGLMTYAGDNEGGFPVAENSSNDGYRKLIPDYIANEKPFYVPGSAWHKSAKNGKPDDDIGTKPDYAQALERGENHWAYISGLTNTSDANLPIIADGFSETKGMYSDVQSKKGGVWKGKKAIIVYVDGTVRQETVEQKSLKIMKTRGGQQVELFSNAYSEDLQEDNIKNPES
jgi:prepilin-type N-terminal cleavage/methylation domain-containing protein